MVLSITKHLLSAWYMPGPVPGMGTLQKTTHSQNAGAPSIFLRGMHDGYSHNLRAGTEASRRDPGSHPPVLGTNSEAAGQDETQSLEFGRTQQPLADFQASSFLSLQVLHGV